MVASKSYSIIENHPTHIATERDGNGHVQMQAFVRVEPPPTSPTFGRGLYHYDRNTEFEFLYPSITRGYNILHSRSVNPCGEFTLDWNHEGSWNSENWFSSAFCLPRTRKHRFPFDQQGFKFVDIHQIYKKNKMFNSALANQQRYIVFCLCMMSRMIFYNFIVIGLLLIRFFDHYRQRNGIQ